MSYQAEHSELKAHFDKEWLGRTLICWPSVVFTPPEPVEYSIVDGGNAIPEGFEILDGGTALSSGFDPNSWVRFNILNGESKQTTIGSNANNHFHPGIITIQIFSVPGKGCSRILTLADIVSGIFRNWNGTNITCRQATVKTIGLDEFGWYQVNVTIPFFRNELF